MGSRDLRRRDTRQRTVYLRLDIFTVRCFAIVYIRVTNNLNRRRFIASSLAAPALSANAFQANDAPSSKARQFYELRHYELRSGAQRKKTEAFLKDALVPGLNKLGLEQIGVFNTEVGDVSPSLYVLIPGNSLDVLVTSGMKLAEDRTFLKAAADFTNTAADTPAYVRVESTLLAAFETWPKLKVPPATAAHGPRVFELRTYESPTDQDHQRKVEMFGSGEYASFERAGFWQIFYGAAVIGPRLPSLTYMIGFADASERDAKWKAFRVDPEFKKLLASSRFNFEPIVSNITNAILTPTAFSQI